MLQGVDLELHDGTILAVLGRNGVGKTTTVRAIMGLVRPSSGKVLLDGEDIAGWAPHRIARAGVAYVPEGRLIFPDLSVIENIRVAERNMTVLLVEHDMEVVFRLAQRITVLHRGAVIADGAPDEVRQDAGVQTAYLGGFA